MFAPQTSDFLEKLALLFLNNFHHEHSLLKSKIKKVIVEKKCEKQKNIFFIFFYFLSVFIYIRDVN